MNLTSEIKFLKEKMNLSDCSRLLDAANIFFEEENEGYLIGNWAKLPENENVSTMIRIANQDNTDIADEIRIIGYLLLELNEVPKNDIKRLNEFEQKNMYDGAIDGVISAKFILSEPIKKLLRWMLDRDPRKRPSRSDILANLAIIRKQGD